MLDTCHRKMSSATLDSELSSAELRSKLFHSFKTKGVVQSVKTQLRKQLALELHEKVISCNSKGKDLKHDGTLFQSICNSLFVDHLKRCTYDYTLSVFISESHTSLQQTIPLHDILELLRINANSKLHEVLTNACTDCNNVKGFLWTFLVAIAQGHRNPTTEHSVQTEDVHGAFPNLDKKMFEIEKSQLEKLQSSIKNDYESVEAKVLAFQRRYEAQKQAELKNEVERFRSSELANMRLEERDKCQKEFLHIKTEYEKRYNSKLKDLERQEMEIHTKALRREKEVEKEGYEQRQKIFEEMDTLKQRDLELKRNHKAALNSVEIEEEKLRSKEEQLKEKEKSMKEIEEHYENKLKHEILRIKVELQEKDIDQVSAMEVREQQLREEKMNFLSQKDVYVKWKDEADRLREDNERLNASVAKTKRSYDVLSQKYEKVCEQHQQVSDYGDVKNENMILRKDLEICKKSFADLSSEKAQMKKEHQKFVRDLLNKINQNSPERENELKLLQEKEQSVSLKYEVLQNKHELLQKSHVLQVKKNEELRKLYEDILLSQRELLRECDELKLELHFANQEKESALRLQSNKSKLPLSTSVQATKDVRISALQNNLKGKQPLHGIIKQDTNLKINISTSNDVLQKLEQEAMELEKSYKQFQERQMYIKTQQPAYIEKTKVTIISAASTSQNTCTSNSNNDVKEDSNPSQTNVTLQSDSFDLSHLIPSRRMTESNEGRDVSKYSTSTPRDNQSSTLVTQALSSFKVNEHKESAAISLVNSQLDSALSRCEDTNNEYIPITFRQRDTQSCNQLLPEGAEYGGHLGSNFYAVSMRDTPLTRSNVDTLRAKSLQMNSLTQITISETNPQMNSLTQQPLMETIQPMDSLTQLPLMGTIQPRDSLTQLTLTESTQPIDSLTQLPLMGTIQPMDSLTQLPLIETIQPINSLTQIPLMETIQPMDSLTQIPLMETIQPMNSLTQIPLTETVVNNASLTQFSLEETKNNFVTILPHITNDQIVRTQSVRRTDVNSNGKALNLSNIVTSITYATSGLDEILKGTMETFEAPVSNDFNIRHDDFNSKSDIFKTSNFMLKGFQSTRMASDELQGQSNETADKAKRSHSIEMNEKPLQRYSTPDGDKNSEVESIQNFPGKSQHSSIRKENTSTDSSNIVSGPFDSEEKECESNTSSRQKRELKAGDFNSERTLSEGEVGHGNVKSEGEISHANGCGDDVGDENGKSEGEVVVQENANPMEQYMQMILSQREAGSKADDNAQTDIQHSVHEDISLSEIEEKNENSEPSSSDFEW